MIYYDIIYYSTYFIICCNIYNMIEKYIKLTFNRLFGELYDNHKKTEKIIIDQNKDVLIDKKYQYHNDKKIFFYKTKNIDENKKYIFLRHYFKVSTIPSFFDR